MKCPCCGQDAPDGAVPDLVFSGGVVYWKGKQLALFTAEMKFLQLLIQRKGSLVTRPVAWNLFYAHLPNDAPDPKIFDVYLVRLRRVVRAAAIPIAVTTVWGRGWMVNDLPTHFIDETPSEDYYANAK